MSPEGVPKVTSFPRNDDRLLTNSFLPSKQNLILQEVYYATYCLLVAFLFVLGISAAA